MNLSGLGTLDGYIYKSTCFVILQLVRRCFKLQRGLFRGHGETKNETNAVYKALRRCRHHFNRNTSYPQNVSEVKWTFFTRIL